MARAPVVQVQCDRCKRVDLIAQDKAKKSDAPVLLLKFEGSEVKYEDLCPRCNEAVKRLVESIKEWEREVKQPFLGQGPTLASNQAPPVQVAPNYSPPQPHAASAKR